MDESGRSNASESCNSHPRLTGPLSVPAQDRYLLRTAVDPRCGQTINRDAKTTGGIKYFANDNKSILKWTLNTPVEAKNTSELLRMVDMKSSNEMYKSLR